jgi:hypothetical protein
MDVGARVTSLDEEEAGPVRTRRRMQVDLFNDKPLAVRMEIAGQWDYPDQGGRIVSESRHHVMKDGGPVWRINLAPGAREVLRYTVETED